MKTNICTTLLVMLAVTVFATNEPSKNYITVNGETSFCQKVKTGLFYTTIQKEDGTVLKIKNKELDAFCCKGHLFERLPLYLNGKVTGKTSMMEYVTSRNGLRLYKYCEYGECGDFIHCNYKGPHLQTVYFVYKDGEFYLEVNRENGATVLPFFGIDVLT